MTEHSAPPTLTQVAVGIVHNPAGQVLFAQRPAGKPYAGWWEFPGGKIEAGETVALALARELREELGIQILDCHHWLTQRYEYPHAHVNLQFCHVQAFSGQPQSLEGQAFAWGTAQQPPLPFLPAALPVLKAMQLPRVLRLTAATELGFDTWQSRLNVLESGCVIVDEPNNASQTAAHKVLLACLAWKSSEPQRRMVLVSSHHPTAWRGLADGVHLTDDDLLACRQRPSCAWVMAAALDAKGIAHAAHLGCDAVTVAAVQGWGVLGDVLHAAQVACFASGDWAEQHLPLANAAGAAGLALKHGAWV